MISPQLPVLVGHFYLGNTTRYLRIHRSNPDVLRNIQSQYGGKLRQPTPDCWQLSFWGPALRSLLDLAAEGGLPDNPQGWRAQIVRGTFGAGYRGREMAVEAFRLFDTKPRKVRR